MILQAESFAAQRRDLPGQQAVEMDCCFCIHNSVTYDRMSFGTGEPVYGFGRIQISCVTAYSDAS